MVSSVIARDGTRTALVSPLNCSAIAPLATFIRAPAMRPTSRPATTPIGSDTMSE